MKKDFSIPSDIGNLRLVEKAIDELSMELNLSDEVYGNIMVATMEATNNAIIHGNHSDPGKNVKIEILFLNRELVVHIEDRKRKSREQVLTTAIFRIQHLLKTWKRSMEGEYS